MPRFVIHIGPYKTGSTYLQTCLRNNAGALREAGIQLARVWEDNELNPSHTGLVVRLNTERKAELTPLFDDWKKSDVRTVIISCEDLSAMSLEPVKVLMLSELLAGSWVEIVYYVRRWSELLWSEWQEYVKQGSCLQLLEVIVHNLRDPIKSRIINIDVCLSVFAEMFGKAAIRVISYDGVIESGEDIFHHFSRCVLGVATVRPERRILNPSLSPAQAELLRLFNVYGRQAGIAGGQLLRFLQAEHRAVPLTRILDHMTGFVDAIDLDDSDPAVRHVLAEMHAAYGDCAVPPVDQLGFYRAKNVKLPFVRPEYALTPGYAEATRKLWRDLLHIENPRLAP